MASATDTATSPPVVSAFRAAFAAGKDMPRSGIVLPVSWTPEACEYFEERAAMLEYNGGLARAEAEQMAMTQTCLALGIEGVQPQATARATVPLDDGLGDLFGDVPHSASPNAVTEGH